MKKKKVKLALGMIVKDEVKELKRILSAYSKYFDEIQITITNESNKQELEEICKKYNAISSFFVWCNDFSKARNYNKSLIKSDYYLRLDADDAIINPEKLREVAQYALDNDVSVIYHFYEYSRDEWGNVNAAHWRDSLIKVTDNLYWTNQFTKIYCLNVFQAIE